MTMLVKNFHISSHIKTLSVSFFFILTQKSNTVKKITPKTIAKRKKM